MENIVKQYVPSSERFVLDRFILPRERMLEMGRRRTWHAGCQDYNDIMLVWDPKYQKQKRYKEYLDEVFGLKQQRPRRGLTEALWPCQPRKKRYMKVADCVLDLPYYSSEDDLLDWSRKNVLVAALGFSYHLFGWQEQSVLGRGIADTFIRSCKCDPRGDLLLLGMRNQEFAQHDMEYIKLIAAKKCSCRPTMLPFDEVCHVTALDWSPTGNSFVIGCTFGEISSFTREMSLISKVSVGNKAPIVTVRVSPDARFVAAVNLRSRGADVFHWPSLQRHSTFRTSISVIVKTVSWHPWRSALLAVGTDVYDQHPHSMCGLWSVHNERGPLRLAALGNKKLDNMLFSHRTGEMVLSLWDPVAPSEDPSSPGSGDIVVMSDPQTVVDQSATNRIMDRIRVMVFNPDGTKLAIATAEEDLIIWNFLPEEKKKHLDKSRRFYALPVYIDEATTGFAIR